MPAWLLASKFEIVIMFRPTQFFLYLILFVATCGSLSSAEPLRLIVLSYNIHHAAGVDGKLDVERIARVIQSVKPDLVALQEVDQKVKRSQTIDEPAELARLTKMHVAFGANIDLQGGHYGNAILSRFPIARHQNHLLPRIDQSEQRGVIEAEITLPEMKQPLLFLATHFDFRSDERERLESVAVINKLADKHAELPALLAGDLNATPESKTLEQLALHWKRANAEVLPTVPVKEPKQQIDYILFRPQNRWKVVDVNVLDEAVASDHRAIAATLELEQ